jgi:hypothetical protein
MEVEPLAGRRLVAVTDRRTRTDWAGQIRDMLDVRYPDARKVVLVMDNLNTHAVENRPYSTKMLDKGETVLGCLGEFGENNGSCSREGREEREGAPDGPCRQPGIPMGVASEG